MREERAYLRRAHLRRVPLVVEEDVLADVIEIRLLCLVTEVFEARDVPRFVKQFGFLHLSTPSREVSERRSLYIQRVIRYIECI